ncbi:MAG: alkaline phosphatase family protein [Puia sp.]
MLTYDENDGYFDHQPPFVAPDSGNPESGKASEGLDTSVEIVKAAETKQRKGHTALFQRESPIGLGFRVPLIVASPWSRGGYVNSEIFDLTSTIQFLEKFLTLKTGKPVKTLISVNGVARCAGILLRFSGTLQTMTRLVWNF